MNSFLPLNLPQSAKIGVMVCGHGSRDEDAVRQFNQMAKGLETRLPRYAVESGFLEFATPVLNAGLDKLRDRGVKHILAIPGMLFAAGHAKNDIPTVLARYAQENQGLDIHYGRELGIDNKMIRAAGARVQEAMARADTRDGPVAPHDTLLVVVGRGASDPDANANVAKITRLLWEGLGFGWGETAYSGVTFPLVTPCLETVAKLGFKRVLVFPYFLFTGILVKRIYDATDAVATHFPEVQFVKAGYLGDHSLVLDTFADRVQEILDGANLMNCMNCKYRETVLGFENEVGLAQESHHHHVEGIGTGPSRHDPSSHHGQGQDHNHSHAHSHDHSQGHPQAHHHHPYPHNDHPMGPRSLPGTVENNQIVCPCGRFACGKEQLQRLSG